jgi:hypothetical protein
VLLLILIAFAICALCCASSREEASDSSFRALYYEMSIASQEAGEEAEQNRQSTESSEPESFSFFFFRERERRERKLEAEYTQPVLLLSAFS